MLDPGTSKSPLECRLRDLSSRGNVRWMGHVSDQDLLLELWGQCGVYVHGHSVGGTNPALLQALGAGAPTLALDTIFNREVVGDDEQLFANRPEVLATRMKEVLADHEVRTRFRERGQAIVHDRYSWDDVCRAYMDMLVGLAND